ncbi:MAG: hypothetical protein EOM00_13475, partial [Clostridia bacterium]|nr:hypothetical protein [Clostridia bacterium]
MGTNKFNFVPLIMIINSEPIRPSASDFGSYVYCGAKLFLDKNANLDSFRKNKINSYNITRKAFSKKIGQQNESKCINWIMKKHKQSQNIIFDGTGKDNQEFFFANIRQINVELHCRPDLIITRDNKIILYEFKAVSDINYLWYSGYDSNHAQIWCYSFIKDFEIDKYYLLKYFEDPFKQGTFPREIEITKDLLSDEKFIPLFQDYLNVIETLNRSRKSLNKNYNLDLNKLNIPINQPQKCHHCIYF